VLIRVLRELAEFVASLSDAQYTGPTNGSQSSSIGSHVRHSLDHVTALLAGANGGAVDYDQRRRGTDVETSRRKAFDRIAELEAELTCIGEDALDKPLVVVGLMTADGPPIRTRSSIARELLFVLSHTIHHNAMIATAAKKLGASVPPRFGYAPATIAFLDGR
jgi:uncharacterized damage-inducible protein DinB